VSVAIHAQNLSKRYRLGEREPYKTLRDSVHRVFRNVFGGEPKRAPNYVWALHDVSFNVDHGEVVGIIGRNGAGKTTLLKILSRITEPSSGRAELLGRVGSLLEVGTGFHPELTGRENTFLSGAILGMTRKEIRKRFDEIVAFAEVERFIDTPVKRYSSGMYLRLAFAVAAHLEPEILLVDEVLAVGDAAFQRKCLGRMGDLAGEGRTVLFVSHNLSAVRNLCSVGLVLDQGEIVARGAVESCIQGYMDSLHETSILTADTRNLPRPTENYGSSFRFLAASLVLGEDPNLCTGRPLTLRLSFECVKTLRGVVIGFSVFAADGTRILQCLNVHAGPAIERLDPGRYSLVAEIPETPLLPGHYMLDIGARCLGGPLDAVRNLLWFEIVDEPEKDVDYHMATEGLVFVRSVWHAPQQEQGRATQFDSGT